MAFLFGKDFPQYEKVAEACQSYDDTEQFVEDLFPIDIHYSLRIDCNVTQKGFRDFKLRSALKKGTFLRHDKSLNFMIEYCSAPEPYNIYWKVRNVGLVAEQKNMIRGQIVKTDKEYHGEHTNFYGPHYVECYIIKDGICVAKDHINVPIGHT